MMGKIIKDIIQLTTSEEEFSKIFIRANEMFEENKLLSFQNINETTKRVLQMDVSKYEIQNSQKENNLEKQEGQIDYNMDYFSMNSNCLDFNKKQQISESFTKSTAQKSFRESKKIQQSYGDGLNNVDMNDYCIQDSSQNYQFSQKSDQFHFAVRKAIAQFIQKQQFIQINNLQQNANFNNVNNLKYIIYCTETIQIFENRMFKLLCQLLIRLKIKLIILAQQNGNSFIEQKENQTYMHDHQQVIMVFYEPQQILNYINNLRCQFNKKVYPTIIQNH
ncbi:tetratricopeptide repeat protein (macronuclear) [Tetrahymena thermophila SB210]|uniref:Tetratricopeptide repeat protein n=1 Tax=Tetrahymena thermophila (strain SB210) TaxID=312017 RepID=Q23MI9_TETTS|nr:tetratricopeptide repeat protein [Tetrahymena thermophila SB210]EAR97650.2 tetratricopeptide repeat protein [Tetrahymena thermophila SB210]|eukprot:XP_001017895.2 tetratricopeptide repeat protein [Tetrahymena thermophila SB210]